MNGLDSRNPCLIGIDISDTEVVVVVALSDSGGRIMDVGSSPERFIWNVVATYRPYRVIGECYG